jgi:hypothetical protein
MLVFVTSSTPVFCWKYFVPLSPGLRVISNHLWQVPWTKFRPLLTRFVTEMWRTGEQRWSHFSRRSHKKPTHVSVFCDSFDSISLVEALEQSVAFTAPFVPIQDSAHPSLLWLGLLNH